MRKDIMLFFLSDVKPMRGQLKVSVTHYKNIGQPAECHATNESAVRYLMQTADAPPHGLSRLFLVRTKLVAGNITWKHDGKDVVYVDESGRKWTHYDYFLHRIEDIVPNAREIAEPIPFDEEASVEENMDTLIDVAFHVRRYAQQVRESDPDTDIFLHVDCTGGMRNASMILVALMRLVQYERITIGKVLYSNYPARRVEEVMPLYSFFDLVAGAEEFVRHGEVSVLQDYFRNREKSPALTRILAAMNRFAEELTLCHYGELRTAIGELGSSIDNFPARLSAASGDARSAAERSDELMRQMLARIQEDYSTILTDEVDDIALIHWCIERGFMQQAMTFFTERVPELLLEKEFLQVQPSCETDFLRKHRDDSMKRGKGFYLVNDYGKKKADGRVLNLARNKWKTHLREFLQRLRKGVTEEEIQTFVRTALSTEPTLRLCDAERLQEVLLWLHRMLGVNGCADLREIPVGKVFLDRACALYFEEKIAKEAPDEAQINRLQEQFFSQRNNVLAMQLLKFITAHMTEKMLDVLFSDIEWDLAAQRMEAGVFSVKDEGLAQRILTSYFAIRDERNHTSHARLETGRMTVEELKEKMRRSLTDIRQACGVR